MHNAPCWILPYLIEWVATNLFLETLQIGNVAIFLERGTEEDHYDFLELYLRRWRKEARLTKYDCDARQRQLLGTTGRRQAMKDTSPQFLNKKYFQGPFNPYDWYAKTNTEVSYEYDCIALRGAADAKSHALPFPPSTKYYFRYEGSMAEPPCIETVHWRVLKDPIRVAPRQINILDKLFARRLDPVTCQYYQTAGKPREKRPHRVDVNRPTQTTTRAHKVVFCECVDWPSRSEADLQWCGLSTEARGVDHLDQDDEEHA